MTTRTPIPVNRLMLNGATTELAPTTATTSHVVAGFDVGKLAIQVTNDAGSDRTVTIAGATIPPGTNSAARIETIGAGTTGWIGLLSPQRHINIGIDGSGELHLDIDDPTDVTVRAYYIDGEREQLPFGA